MRDKRIAATRARIPFGGGNGGDALGHAGGNRGGRHKALSRALGMALREGVAYSRGDDRLRPSLASRISRSAAPACPAKRGSRCARLPRPVLVGGGAVEFYTGSALMTGDIDVTSPVQSELEEELAKLGFRRPPGLGHAGGWLHADSALAFEVVGSVPMGGTVDATRIRLIAQDEDSGRFRVLAVEDMIADRMGPICQRLRRGCWIRRESCSLFIRKSIELIWKGAFALKRQTIMASKTSMAEAGEAVAIAAFGRDLARRRAEYEAANGPLVVARNDGSRRTPEKRALLDAVDKLAAAKGFRW